MPVYDETKVLLQLGAVLLCGYVFGNLAQGLKLPRVSGYILAGIVLSPSVFGLIDQNFLRKAHILTDASLSFITFMIGLSLPFRKLKALGKRIVLITLGEAEVAFLVTSISMCLALAYIKGEVDTTVVAMAIILGVLASPTDPTATIAVMHQYKAKGELSATVLGVTALDDVMGIVNFALGFSLASSIMGGGSLSLFRSVGGVVFEIFGALALGVLGGVFMYFLGAYAKERKEIVTLSFGVLLVVFSGAKAVGVDALLATMSVGVSLANIEGELERFREPLENYIEDLIFSAFFVVGSAYLNPFILISFAPLIGIYVISRFSGKFIGSYIGGVLSGAPDKVRNNIAFALVPQGGIVIGLALLSFQNTSFEDEAKVLVNVIIGSTVIHEFLGPILSGLALKRAGEV